MDRIPTGLIAVIAVVVVGCSLDFAFGQYWSSIAEIPEIDSETSLLTTGTRWSDLQYNQPVACSKSSRMVKNVTATPRSITSANSHVTSMPAVRARSASQHSDAFWTKGANSARVAMLSRRGARGA